MEFVEIWRVRRALIWHAGILAALVLVILTLPQVGAVHVDTGGGSTQFVPGHAAPLSALAALAGFFAAIFASSVGTSLNRESATRDISWTKPLSRTVLALRFVVIDLAGVTLAFGIALAAAIAVVADLHAGPIVDSGAALDLVTGAGVGGMWYGLLQLLTCAFPPGARSLGGILWPIALGISALAQLPGPLGNAVRIINLISPLHYLSKSTYDTMSDGEIALIVWGCALAFCAAAIYLWPRKEA